MKINRKLFDETMTRRMFFVPSFEMYGGVKGLYDFGLPGTALKNNVLQSWRQHFVMHDQMLEIESVGLTPEAVLEVSGHVAKFADWLVYDLKTGEGYRADHILQEHIDQLLTDKSLLIEERNRLIQDRETSGNMNGEQLNECIQKYGIKCKETGNDFSKCEPFNMMFKTSIGPTGKLSGYLRPETAQGIFLNFPRLLDSNSNKMPFAAAQIGTAFRNEISPRSGLLRVREFTLAEIEYFCRKEELSKHPRFKEVEDVQLTLYSREAQIGTISRDLIKITAKNAVETGLIANHSLAYFMSRTYLWLIKIGIHQDKLRFRQHLSNEMAHYARDCWDAEILSSYGWIECVGHADRSAYDLTQHGNATKQRISCHQNYETPIIRKVWRAKAVMSEICKDSKNGLREASKLLSKYFSDLNEDHVLKLKEQLMELNGEETIKVMISSESGSGSGSGYLLKPSMVEVFQDTEKITGETYIPYVIEPSFGIGRIIYCLLEHAFLVREDKKNDTKNLLPVYLSLSPLVAPISCAVLSVITDKANAKPIFKPHVDDIMRELSDYGIMCRDDDSSATIGRKYARFDEIGTPFVITVDSETMNSQTVTLRERDSIEQIRIPKKKVPKIISNLIHLRLSWKELKDKFELI